MLLSKKTSIKVSREYANLIGHMCYAASKLWNVCNYERQHYKETGMAQYPDYVQSDQAAAYLLHGRSAYWRTAFLLDRKSVV